MARWRTLELHTDPGAALIQVSALQAAGFLSFIDNFYHALVIPHYALALGGFRVVVEEEVWEDALIFVSGSDAIAPEFFDAIDQCARCDSTDVFRGASLILSILGFLCAGVPLPMKTDYRRCRRCGNQWHKSVSE